MRPMLRVQWDIKASTIAPAGQVVDRAHDQGAVTCQMLANSWLFGGIIFQRQSL
jgi:hypothetical protein